jgi:S-methylmethionine-dependent homocysteine/selenocysteine methylase
MVSPILSVTAAPHPPTTGAARFLAAVAERRLVLTEGALIEQLRRDPRIGMDPLVANASLLYTRAGREALVGLWTGYVDVARRAGLPVIVCTPTWRANRERLQRAGLPAVGEVSRDAVALLERVRAAAGDHAPRVFLGALLGCRGDSYLPGEALDAASAERFHREQAEALAGAAPDFLLAATLPACSEAVGLARALAATRLPYVLSFVLRPSGTLLDGTPLQAAVARIDAAADPPPAFYLGGCVHPVHFGSALAVATEASPGLEERVIGVQGNASRKAPEELEGSQRVDADEPEAFADAMEAVRRRFGARVLGGCCGTDERHMAAVARRAARAPTAG